MPKPILIATVMLLASGLAFAGPGDSEPEITAAKIVEHCLRARGGAERLRSVQAIRLGGTLESSGISGSFTMTMTADGRYRNDVEIGGMQRTIIADGTQVWQIAGGGASVTRLEGKGAELFFEERCDPFGPMPAARCPEYTLELAGEVEVDGTPCYHLLVHLPSGRTQEWFIDRQTWLPVQRLVPAWVDWFGDHQAVLWYFDYSEHDGVLMPSLMERETAETFVQSSLIETVELDPDLDKQLFSVPAPPPEPAE